MAGSIQSNPTWGLTPTPQKIALPTNYISSTQFNYLNQFLPDTYEREFERYGNRSVAALIRLFGAEIPSNSDMIKWAEQGRLHIKYTGMTSSGNTGSAGYFTFTNPAGTMAFRAGQQVFLSGSNGNSGVGLVTSVTTSAFVCVLYGSAIATDVFPSTATVTAFVYGSEFQKGTAGMVGSLESQDTFFDNKPIILKDNYQVSGSDMSQIGWVNITTEDGAGGYLWYVKSQHETRLRFDDYLEMSMIEGQPAIAGSQALLLLSPTTTSTYAGATGASTQAGTKGLFYEVSNRGNVWSGGNPTALTDWDTIFQRLDKQGAIQENAMMVNRQFSFDTSDMLAAQNSYGANGTSYGLFNNDKTMALNLGFQQFTRGYDVYYSDWKYLNDATTRGDIVAGGVNGILIPAGSTNVYDQVIGKNMKRPFLHVRYRASESEDRRYKTWVTGGAGGAATSDLDAMTVSYLSERCMCTLGANNFFIFKN